MENKKKWLKNLVVSEKSSTFATAFEKYLNCLTDAPSEEIHFSSELFLVVTSIAFSDASSCTQGILP